VEPGVTTDNCGSARTLIKQLTDRFASSTDGRPVPYNDEVYDTPSAAAMAARNGSANGWRFWAADTPDGQFTLAALRDLYMEQRST